MVGGVYCNIAAMLCEQEPMRAPTIFIYQLQHLPVLVIVLHIAPAVLPNIPT